MDANYSSETAQGGIDPTRTMRVSDAVPGGTIGAYRLIRQLGEGGMGVVYHAQQQRPIRREVALKIIKPGMDSKQVIARFESERQALALMDHPNIAHVYDAGATENGLPYFVMELVDGAPLTRYSDSKRLTIQERIELFIPVCQAIQHAHQKGIIHRDIKPSNILVKHEENGSVPKVIDFGLAKALGAQLGDATMTTFGTVAGTLNYMSPEQAELNRQDVDTRTDIYSMGAVLYELLTGKTPLEGLDNESYFESLQRIRDEETKTPSSRISKSGELGNIAELRRTDPSKLPKLLDRELDWIVMKALEKDRTRRYETVNGLARDLQRYLAGEPVEAAPPSTAYRLGKIVRRYRGWLVTVAAFVLVLAAAAIISVLMAVRASRAQAESAAVADFLQNDLLAQASAYRQQSTSTPDPNITVRTALDRAATRIEGKFAKQPLLDASIRNIVGTVYIDLGRYDNAAQQFERALAIRRRELGDRNADTLATMTNLATVYERRGKVAQAEPLYSELVETDRRILGERHPNTLKTMNGLAVTYMEQGEYKKAQELFLRLLPLEQQVLGEHDLQTLRVMGNLASTYDMLQQYDLAEPFYEKTLILKRRWLGDENPETLDTMSNFGALCIERGEYAKAEPLIAATLSSYRRVLGDRHPHTLNAMNNLADLYRITGRNSQAKALFAEAVENAHKASGEEHWVALSSLFGLAQTYQHDGHLDEAASQFAKVLEARQRVLGKDHPDTLETCFALGRVKMQQQKYADAEGLFRQAVAGYRNASPDGWELFDAQVWVGASLAHQKKFADAEPMLVSGYEEIVKRKPVIPAYYRSEISDAGEQVTDLYRQWGRPEKVAEWQAKLH